MNFGPLNKDGGERRLNVAVTRAREKVDLVSSVRASDFTLSDGASPGARLLRDYIAYAETGGGKTTAAEVSEQPVPAGELFPSPFEEDIGEVISELGFDSVPDFGSALSGSTSRCGHEVPNRSSCSPSNATARATRARPPPAIASVCGTRSSQRSAGVRSIGSGPSIGYVTAPRR
jgi:hypothetical protein